MIVLITTTTIHQREISMIVYRFQNDKAQGPWTGNASEVYDQHQRTRNKRHSCGDMPAPFDMAELGTQLHNHCKQFGVGHWHFGFTSLAQLRQAFPSSVGRLAMGQVGQRLMAFEVRRDFMMRGAAQCIFDPAHATYQFDLDLKTLKYLDARIVA